MKKKTSKKATKRKAVTSPPKPINVGIGICSYGEQVHASYMVSFIRDLISFKTPFTVLPYTADSLVQRGRNTIANICMSHPNLTHLLFVDADISFSAGAIQKLIDADKDIIGGGYPIKQMYPERLKEALDKGCDHKNVLYYGTRNVVQIKPGTTIRVTNLNEPVEVDFLGTGFILIKREVLEKMREALPEMQYNNPEPKGRYTAYFHCTIEHETYLSEDYYFTNKAKELGFKVWLHPGVFLVHHGQFRYQGDFLSGNGVVYKEHMKK